MATKGIVPLKCSQVKKITKVPELQFNEVH